MKYESKKIQVSAPPSLRGTQLVAYLNREVQRIASQSSAVATHIEIGPGLTSRDQESRIWTVHYRSNPIDPSLAA
uniref:hypothetical protein n=1 Tax=Nocardia suismassiliense TaxID=2077092 RepID=UPI003F4952F8